MNVVVSDPKSGKAYGKKLEAAAFLNKRIGEEVDLKEIGLDGYTAKITGGSDEQGFPMKGTLKIPGRKKLLMYRGIGYRPKRRGEKKRKTVRGAVVGAETAQLNLVVVKAGATPLDKLISKPVEEKEEKPAKEDEKGKAAEEKRPEKPAKEKETEKPSEEKAAEKKEEKAEEKGEKSAGKEEPGEEKGGPGKGAEEKEKKE